MVSREKSTAGSHGRRSVPRGTVRNALAALTLVALLLAAGGCTEVEQDATTTQSEPATTATAATTTTTVTEDTAPDGGEPPTGFESETERLAPKEGPFAVCRDCHPFLDRPGQIPRTLMQNFSHSRHLSRGAGCDSCHEQPVHAETGTRRPTMARCFTCHGDTPEATASGACEYCHPPDFPKIPSSHTQAFFQRGHAQVVERQGPEDCLLCHAGTEDTFCRGCHGIDLPHPEGWTRNEQGQPGTHVQESFQQGEVCVKCHDNRVDPPGNCYGGECHGS